MDADVGGIVGGIGQGGGLTQGVGSGSTTGSAIVTIIISQRRRGGFYYWSYNMVCEECEPETHLLTISQRERERERERERDKLNKLVKLGDSNKFFTHTKSKFVSW